MRIRIAARTEEHQGPRPPRPLDVCLHAVEKNGTREFWWVLNADGVDGEEGYWTTRNTAGECKYFCDAGWGDAGNAIAHLEEELAG